MATRYLVRPLAYYDDSGSAQVGPHPDYSDAYDIGDAVQISVALKVVTFGSGGANTLQVAAQTSVDRVHWAQIGTITTASVGESELILREADVSLRRFLRFQYSWPVAEAPLTVFSVEMIIATRDSAGLFMRSTESHNVH